MSSAFAAIGMFIANGLIKLCDQLRFPDRQLLMMPIMAPLSDVVGVTRQMQF